MKQFDTERWERWKPYAVLTLFAGGIGSFGTILGATQTLLVWCCTPSIPTFEGSVNGLGGYSDMDNNAFAAFLSEHAGGFVQLDVSITVVGPSDVTPKESTCVSSDWKPVGDPELLTEESYKFAWMDNPEMLAMYENPDLATRLLGWQVDRQAGDTFIVTHNTDFCQSIVVRAPEDKVVVTSAHMHGLEAVIEGEYKVFYNEHTFGIADEVVLNER